MDHLAASTTPTEGSLIPRGDDPEDIRQRVTYLKRRIDQDCFVIAKDLWRIYHRKLYLDYGYETYEDYVTGPEVGYSIDKATRMRRLWSRLILDFNLSPSQVDGLSYSNANLILPHMKPSNAHALVEAGRSMSRRQLDHWLSEEGHRVSRHALPAPAPADPSVPVASSDAPRLSPPAGVDPKSLPEDQRPRRRSFVLFPEQATLVDEALAEAGRVAESDKEGHKLACMALEFMASRMTREGKKDSRLHYYMRHLERIYGGRLLHIKKPEIGFQLLSKLVEERPDVFALGDKPDE